MNLRRFGLLLLILVSGALAAVAIIAGGNRNTRVCQANLKQIGLAAMQYIRDYDEKFVLHDDWKADLWPYGKREIFDCPSDGLNYAINRYASGINWNEIDNPPLSVAFFDSNSTLSNAADFGSSYSENGAHSVWKRGRGTNVLFLDGHVEWMQQKPQFLPLKPFMTPKPKKTAAKALVSRAKSH